jgi:heme/copper-type cytochrome/quinol oxidase subunit 2
LTAAHVNQYLSSNSLVGGAFRNFFARINPFIEVYASKHFVEPSAKLSLRSFDSNMVADEDIRSPSQVRLLSVDHPITLPVGVPIRLSVTASDVIHS